MRKQTLAVFGLILASLLASCGRSQKDSATHMTPAFGPPACPFSKSGMLVMVEDVEDGVSLTITGRPDQVALMRRWGFARAATTSPNTMRSRKNKGMLGGEHMMHRMGIENTQREAHSNRPGHTLIKRPPTHASAREVPGGVELTFRAWDRQDLHALREQVGRHAARVRQGRCPSMPPST